MDDKSTKYLHDIAESIGNIDSFFETRPRRFQTFQEDICFRNAVQWNIAVIGEAMNRILKIHPDINITAARKIVATRNYIIHGYDSLRDDLLWAIVINHLPLLKQEVEALLTQR